MQPNHLIECHQQQSQRRLHIITLFKGSEKLFHVVVARERWQNTQALLNVDQIMVRWSARPFRRILGRTQALAVCTTMATSVLLDWTYLDNNAKHCIGGGNQLHYVFLLRSNGFYRPASHLYVLLSTYRFPLRLTIDLRLTSSTSTSYFQPLSTSTSVPATTLLRIGWPCGTTPTQICH